MNLIAATALVFSMATVDPPGSVPRMFETYKALGRESEFREFYETMFAVCADEDLPYLTRCENDSIATQAAWQMVTLTVPVVEQIGAYEPSAEKLNWFLGFLEGRSRATVPEWWRNSVLAVKAHHRENFYVGHQDFPLRRNGVGFLNCPTDATVTEIDGVVTYQSGDNTVVVPEEFVRHRADGSPTLHVACAFTEKHCIMALGMMNGYPNDVVCIDRESNKICWQSEACGCLWGGASRMSLTCVSVVFPDDDRAFVFGASGGFWAHGFSIADGSTIFRFSSGF